MITGLSHITFVVKDTERSARIFTDVLGGKEIYDSKGRNFSLSREKFFDVAGLWIALMEGESLPKKTYNHVAFKIEENNLGNAKNAIQALGLEFKPSRSRVDGEGQRNRSQSH